MNPVRLAGELAVVLGLALIVFDVLSPVHQMGLLAILVTVTLVVGGGLLLFWSFGRGRRVKLKR